MKPKYAKGHARKAIALHAMKKFNEEVLAYEEGLQFCPDDATLKEMELFSSPKSGPVVMPSSKRMMVMPSSKSGPAIDLEELLEQNPELRKELEQRAKEVEELEGQGENRAKDRVIMPSSKKAGPLFQPKQQQQK